MTKTIAYAYPTSPNATSLGFGKTGCFYVAKIERTKNGFTEYTPKGFASYAEAFRFAETLPDEYDVDSINVYHAKTRFINASSEVQKFHKLRECQAFFDSCKGNDTEKCLYLVHKHKALRLSVQDVLDFFIETRKTKIIGKFYIVEAVPESIMLQPFFPGKFDNMEGFYLPRRISN